MSSDYEDYKKIGFSIDGDNEHNDCNRGDSAERVAGEGRQVGVEKEGVVNMQGRQGDDLKEGELKKKEEFGILTQEMISHSILPSSRDFSSRKAAAYAI